MLFVKLQRKQNQPTIVYFLALQLIKGAFRLTIVIVY
jgi:hypothetical protein